MISLTKQISPKFISNGQSVHFHSSNLAIISRKLEALLNQTRNFVDTTKDKSPIKEEEVESLKMPGFVHPDTMHDDGYFTQKAKKQLEELKRKDEKPKVENPDKKE